MKTRAVLTAIIVFWMALGAEAKAVSKLWGGYIWPNANFSGAGVGLAKSNGIELFGKSGSFEGDWMVHGRGNLDFKPGSFYFQWRWRFYYMESYFFTPRDDFGETKIETAWRQQVYAIGHPLNKYVFLGAVFSQIAINKGRDTYAFLLTSPTEHIQLPAGSEKVPENWLEAKKKTSGIGINLALEYKTPEENPISFSGRLTFTVVPFFDGGFSHYQWDRNHTNQMLLYPVDQCQMQLQAETAAAVRILPNVRAYVKWAGAGAQIPGGNTWFGGGLIFF